MLNQYKSKIANIIGDICFEDTSGAN